MLVFEEVVDLWLLCYVVDGGWSNYTANGSCSETCGIGVVNLKRTCNNPRPFCGGQECMGTMEKVMDCGLPDCVTSGNDRE